MQTESLALL
jgi:hypothetical protein